MARFSFMTSKTFANGLANRLYQEGGRNWLFQVAIFSFIVSPVLFIAIFSYTKTHRELTEFTLSRRESIAYLAATTLKHQFDRLTDLGTSLATRVRFRQLVSEGKWEEAIQILKGVSKDFPFIDRLFLADPSCTLMADIPPVLEVRGRNFSFRDWYRGVSAKWEPYISEVYKRAAAPQNNVVAVAAPIKSEAQKVVGILVLQVQLDTFLEWSRGIEVGSGGFVYFVDKMGRVAAHPRYSPQGEIVDFSTVPSVQKALRGERGVGVLLNPIEKEERVVAFAQVPKYGWGVMAVQPTRIAFGSRDSNLRFLSTVYGFIVLLTCVLAYVILRTFAAVKQREEQIKQLNEELKQRAAELEVTNKELEAFSYSVSHDLRAPLRATDGFSLALLEDYADKLDSQGKDYLNRVRESSQHMAQLIDDMLNLSRVTRSEMRLETVNLSSLAQTIAVKLKQSEPQRQVEFAIAEGLFAKGDEPLLRVALENLLGNAWKFTGKHPGARIEFGTEQMDGRQVYYVRDDGVGFDMAYADKLFGAFQRLHGRTEFPGTGIGLATVQRIIHRHGGRVWAKGRKGQGATFYFTI